MRANGEVLVGRRQRTRLVLRLRNGGGQGERQQTWMHGGEDERRAMDEEKKKRKHDEAMKKEKADAKMRAMVARLARRRWRKRNEEENVADRIRPTKKWLN